MAKKPPMMPASGAKPKSAKAIGKQPSFMAGKAKPFGGAPATPSAAAARRSRLAGKKL